MFLVDTVFDGQPVRALAQPNRNGYLYVLDARTGKFLRGTQYTEKLNWAKGLDANGRPIPHPKFVAMPTGGGLLASLFGQNPQMTLGNSLVVFALP